MERLTTIKSTVGASLFVRNAIKYDYPVIEAITSILPFEQVVVMDCSSDDGTTEMLQEFCKNYSQIKLVTGQKWEVCDRESGRRLSILANIAKSYLTTDWHFMLQADEVLPYKSYKTIMSIVRSVDYMNVKPEKFLMHRYNLWGNKKLMVSDNSQKKPVSNQVCRLARTCYDAVGDAESIEPTLALSSFSSEMPIIHYGFLRHGATQLVKIIDMQSWFWGEDRVDIRAIDQHKKDQIFRPSTWIDRKELVALPIKHPDFMTKWLSQRVENDSTFELIKE